MSGAYWVLSQEDLREMLERAVNGESIDLVLMELYANSDVTQVEGE